MLINSPTLTNTPDLLLNLLLLSVETSMFLLVGFHHLFLVQHISVLRGGCLLFIQEVVAESGDALLIVVELSQAHLEVVLVKVVHQRLVPLGLKKRDVGVGVGRPDNGWVLMLKRN